MSYANEIEYCDFFGTIKSSGSTYTHLGGIVGSANGYVRNCGNFGTVDYSGTYSGTFVGGIAGNIAMGPAFVYNSYNKADISSTFDSTGGLIGYNGNAIDNYIFDNGYNVGTITNNKNNEDSEVSSTETLFGLQFWGEIRNAYILRKNNSLPYEFINRYENTCQVPFKYQNIAHFYGEDTDIDQPLSQRVYTATVKSDSKPFSVTGEEVTDKTLLSALNEQVEKNDDYLPWVVYSEPDPADSVTNEDAIIEKEAAFDKVKAYKYPMLGHKSTIKYETEADEAKGDAVVISEGADSSASDVIDAAYRTVTVDPRPKAGYKVKSVKATDGYERDIEVRELSGGRYAYTMPRTGVTVSVSYENATPVKFHTNRPGAEAEEIENTLFRVYNADASSGLNPENGFHSANSSGIIEHFYDIPKFAEDDYVFAGWYYNPDKGNGDGDTPYNFTIAHPSEVTDVYAHWIAVGEVDKDEEDDKVLPDSMDGKYRGFELFGVQIRPERNFDTNYNEYTPGGLRFVASISEDLIKAIDALPDGVVDGNNVEYGFVTAAEKTINTVVSDSRMNIDAGTYTLQYKGENVNGVDTLLDSATSAERQCANNFRYVTNVDCTSEIGGYGSNPRIKEDHRNYSGYRLATYVVTYDDDSTGDNKAKNVAARAYLRYTDANGKLRTFYNDYNGTNFYGGCSTSYNKAQEYATNKVTVR